MQNDSHVSPWNADDVVAVGSDLRHVPQIVDAAARAAGAWATTSRAQRVEPVQILLGRLSEDRDQMIEAISADTGRLKSSAAVEFDSTVVNTQAIAVAYNWSEDSGFHWAGGLASLQRVPIGPSLLITPGNFPFSAIIRKVSAALLAGCPAVVKTSELAPRTAARIQNAVHGVFPSGVLQFVRGSGLEGVALLETGVFDAVSFTGSTRTGKSVAKACSEFQAKLQLETGGKNVVVVDQGQVSPAVVKTVVKDFCADGGQSCSSTSRLVVVGDDNKEVRDLFQEELKAAVVGRSPDALYGPLMSTAAVARAESALAAEEPFADVVRYGSIVEPDNAPAGYLITPAVVWGVAVDSAVWLDELFAPVLAVTFASSFEEAMRKANASNYGLAAAVFSDSARNIQTFCREMDAGKLVVNAAPRSGAPQVPMAGSKDSGFGEPENGVEGIRFYTKPKAIYYNGGRTLG